MLNIGYILDGKYEVQNVLGSGGMGTVYLCKNNRLGNLWAIKEITREVNAEIDFLAEPNMLKDLRHPGIPKVIDIFIEDENLYMVEEYIEGENLKELVEKNGVLLPEKATDIALKLCDILSYLHSFSPPIIYRDLKPSNIMQKAAGEIILVDFGIARTYKEENESDTMILGSRGYMAPELLNNAQSNIQSDLYSLGATLYFLITGDSITSSQSNLQTSVIALQPGSRLMKIINKATAFNLENRYKSILEVKKDLKECMEDYPKTKLITMKKPMDDTLTKTQILPEVKNNKKGFFIASGILLLLLILISAYLLLNHSNANNHAATNDSNKPINDQLKNSNEIQKTPVERDMITRGILYKDSPLVLSNNTEGSKGKGKNKGKGNQSNFDLLFNLNPSASYSNSKITITVNSIEIVNSLSMLDVTINNTSTDDLNLDLTKTALTDGQGNSFSPTNIDTGIVTVAQNSTKNIKLTFKDFDFTGNSYSFSTNVNYGVMKDINLYIDVK